jgi:hypothetical protein
LAQVANFELASTLKQMPLASNDRQQKQQASHWADEVASLHGVSSTDGIVG